jgi:hypothetical protein
MGHPGRIAVVAGLCLLAALPAHPDEGGPPGAAEHLLAGVRAFRADRYEEALAEFRLVQQMGTRMDLALYLGPTLYHLGRYTEARSVLAREHRSGRRDAVAEYYLALSYHQLGYLRLARGIFSAIDRREAGPRLAEGASRFVAAVDAQPTFGVDVGRYLAVAATAGVPVDDALDAAAEAFLRAPPGGPERERAGLMATRLALAVGAPSLALELLAGGGPLPVELERARAALASHDPARARALLEGAAPRTDPTTRRIVEELAAGIR